MNEKLLNRFLRYVQIDTESVSDVEQVPSTEKQKNLSNLLAEELRAMGASNVRTDEHAYVYATIPANNGGSYSLGFIAHVDTSEAVSGKDVKPVVTKNYDGKDIALAEGRVLSPKDFPEMANHKGKTIISSDGTTLLGADDKAGVAVIMQMAETLFANPQIPHGTIQIAFTPDEEVGNGTAFFDVAGFGANGAYTIDGGGLGELENENFNAASAKIDVDGISVHPGTAKGKMVNASEVAMEFHRLLPENQKPEYTENREGFFHLCSFEGTVDHAHADYIIRDHDKQKFADKKQLFADAVEFMNKKYGADTVKCTIKDSYYNMIEKLVGHEHLVENAQKAMLKAGVTPIICPIRGGTDGAMLSYKGLPCPNLFTGGYNFHGRYEYIPLEDMEKVLETVLNLVDIYKDK